MSKHISGSAARQLGYEGYEQAPSKRIYKNSKNSQKIKFKMILIIVAVFAMCAVVMYRNATITKLGYDIDNLNNEYNAIKNENAHLKVKIENAENLSNIKEIAESKLGLREMESYQIVYVSIPKNDFVKKSQQ